MKTYYNNPNFTHLQYISNQDRWLNLLTVPFNPGLAMFLVHKPPFYEKGSCTCYVTLPAHLPAQDCTYVLATLRAREIDSFWFLMNTLLPSLPQWVSSIAVAEESCFYSLFPTFISRSFSKTFLLVLNSFLTPFVLTFCSVISKW